MDHPQTEPLQIKRLGDGDIETFMALLRLFEEVFEMPHFAMPPRAYLQSLLQRDELLIFVALRGAMVVGGFTAHVIPSYFLQASLVYLQDLAVKGAYQRQGIGRMLMEAGVQFCRDNGYQELFLEADVVDDYALEFYRATGANEENTVTFMYVTGPAIPGSY